MKQSNLFGREFSAATDSGKYSVKVEAPVYTPNGHKPHLLSLLDESKTNRLIEEIKRSSLGDAEKEFLTAAACRHTVFDYEKIAEYYAHSDAVMQDLMERSGLVIVDFDKAIEHGYVKLCDDIRNQYLEEYES